MKLADKDWQQVFAQSRANQGYVDQDLPAYKIAWPENTWLTTRRRLLAKRVNIEEIPPVPQRELAAREKNQEQEKGSPL
jgi:hypothetical protein